MSQEARACPVRAMRPLFIQLLISLGLSIVFSALPLVAALTLDKSSLPLAVFMAWYSLFPPLVIFLVSLWMNLKQQSWIRALGAIWLNLSLWFLLQYLLSALAGLSVLLVMLSLPAVLSGNTLLFLFAGLISLILGIVLYLAGGAAANPTTRPVISWTCFSLLMAVILVLVPVFMTVTSNPAIKAPAASALPTQDKVFGYISDVYNLGERRTGSEADHKAIAYLQEKLRGLGFKDVRAEETTFDYWEVVKYGMTVLPAGGAAWEPECFYVPYSGPTPAEGVTADVVYLGNISKPDWKDVAGKIVLVDIPATSLSFNQMKMFSYMAYEPENQLGNLTTPYPVGWMLKYIPFYKQVETRGPAGIIGILRDYPVMGKFTYYAPYDGELRHIPSMYLLPAEGDKLKAQLKDGKASLKMVLQADVSPAGGKTSNVFALLPGKSSTTLMVHSHHDAPWRSGVEDSSGVGVVMALAEYYSRLPLEERPYTMLFMFTGSHMVGAPSNSDFVARHGKDLVANMLFDIAIEHIADDYMPGSTPGEGLTPRGVFITENPVTVSLYATTVYEANASRTLLFPTGGPLGVPSDASPFQKAGIPIVSLVSGPTWLFDDDDTLDRVHKASLAPMARMYIDFVSRLAATPEFLLRFNLTWAVLGLLVLFMSPLAALFLAYRKQT
jgi:hypothetical protein